MIYSNFIKADKITAKISQNIISGNHIKVDGNRFEKLSKKPYGKTIVRKLMAVDKSESITCYA